MGQQSPLVIQPLGGFFCDYNRKFPTVLIDFPVKNAKFDTFTCIFDELLDIDTNLPIV